MANVFLCELEKPELLVHVIPVRTVSTIAPHNTDDFFNDRLVVEQVEKWPFESDTVNTVCNLYRLHVAPIAPTRVVSTRVTCGGTVSKTDSDVKFF